MIAERFKFHWHNQHEGEMVAQYLAKLRKFSEQCNFKEYHKEALCNRLVCGLRSEVIQRRLLTEESVTHMILPTVLKLQTGRQVSCRRLPRQPLPFNELLHLDLLRQVFFKPVTHCKNKVVILAKHLVTTVA